MADKAGGHAGKTGGTPTTVSTNTRPLPAGPRIEIPLTEAVVSVAPVAMEPSEMAQDKVMEIPSSPAEASTHVLKDEGNFILNVSQFYNQEAISDVIIKIGDEQYYGHKFVLAKSSDVFRTMLYESRWANGQQVKELELSESSECRAVFDKFLKFLYTAEIVISSQSAVGILCLADKYNVSSLKNLCTLYMTENTKSPKVQNALHWYSWAKALHLEELIEQCYRTIAWNTEAILESDEWLKMDIDYVTDILHSRELVVKSEYALYTALVNWLHQDANVPNLRENATKLFPLVRFPQMMVQQLYEIENGVVAEKEECREVLLELLGKAYRFRSLCPSQSDLKVSFADPFYMPRNYLELAVDHVRMQNTLRFGIQVDVRTYVGPVPSTSRVGEWKLTYRKNVDSWSLQIYCHESAMIEGEARIQATILIYNEDDKVVQVHQEPTYVCSRGNHLNLNIEVDQQDDSKLMEVILKPVPT